MGQPFLKSAVAVLEKSGKPLAAREIVEQAIAGGLLDCGATDASSATMRGVLTNNIRQKGAESHFVVQDDKFGLRAGGGAPAAAPAAAPKGTVTRPAGKPGKPPSPQQLSGAGAEHLVVYELSIGGYSAVMPEPDEGVDIVASKNGRDYPLQVKTSMGKGGLYTFRFKKSSHERLLRPNAHYVFVLRKQCENVFVVVPYAEIQRQINLDNIPLKNGVYHAKMRLNTVSLGGQRADMSTYEHRWPGAE